MHRHRPNFCAGFNFDGGDKFQNIFTSRCPPPLPPPLLLSFPFSPPFPACGRRAGAGGPRVMFFPLRIEAGRRQAGLKGHGARGTEDPPSPAGLCFSDFFPVHLRRRGLGWLPVHCGRPGAPAPSFPRPSFPSPLPSFPPPSSCCPLPCPLCSLLSRGGPRGVFRGVAIGERAQEFALGLAWLTSSKPPSGFRSGAALRGVRCNVM